MVLCLLSWKQLFPWPGTSPVLTKNTPSFPPLYVSSHGHGLYLHPAEGRQWPHCQLQWLTLYTLAIGSTISFFFWKILLPLC